MRKVIAWTMGALMLVGALGTAPTLAADEQTSLAGWMPEIEALVLEDPIGVQEGTELIIGTTTRMSGDFATDMWGTNTADMDVRALLHSYETVSWTRFGSMQFNSVVVKSVVHDMVGGENMYTLEIYDDLLYSDGSAVTAADYVFALLLSCAPQIAEIGGTPQGLGHLKGFDAYQSGEAEALAGVRLLSDTEFQLIIPGGFLPYFYGVAMLQVSPFPIAVIAPGCEIRDDGEGSYIYGEFTAELLQETMLNPETGYVRNPQVVSGPYTLESYDGESSAVSFLINLNFKGNALGQKPRIERLEMRLVSEEDALELLTSGEIGLMNKVMDDEVVYPGMDMVDAEEIRMASYPRSGLGFLSFACEKDPASSLAVRQALMRAVDKDAIIEASPQTMSATRVEGYYGLGQWMVGYSDGGGILMDDDDDDFFASDASIPDGEILSIPEILDQMRMEVDVEGAIALLEGDGWTLNEAGERFSAERDTIRYRLLETGQLQPLKLHVAMAEEMTMGPAVRGELEKTLPLLGIGVEITELSFPDLLRHYYRQVERTYDVFFMGTNFNYLFDPYYYFHTSPLYQGMLNTTGLQDEQLMLLALDMRNTQSMDMRAYAEKWLRFQERFIEMAPMVPLYSNIYFDFYRPDLWGYNPITSAGWSLALPYAYISDVPLLGEDEMELSFDEIGFGDEIEEGMVLVEDDW
ncbi:MAG: ABC transporter substrate-binding protein [Clostridia bacterium]|nr:ABC transporter substrate-binding protein [Clostridia bacterium]